MTVERLKLIVGHVTDQSARIWIQGAASHPTAEVTVHGADGSSHRKTLSLPAGDLHTGVVDFDGLAADTDHTCLVQLHGTPAAGARGGFRTFPPEGKAPPQFCFTVVSCNSRNPLTARDFMKPVWDEVQENRSRFVLHVGDNVYYDKFANIFKFGAEPSLERYRRTYNDVWGGGANGRDLARSSRKILSECANFMILDDHEITNNFDPDEDEEFQAGLRAYQLFQHSHNPPTPAGQYFYPFSYGDVAFFVMDARLERDRKKGRMISEAQEKALFRWLAANKDRIKFLVSPVPFWCHTVFDANDKWSGDDFSAQRDRIITFLAKNSIERLIVITGDMHSSYHHITTVSGGGKTLRYHELMSSPVDHWLRARAAFDAKKTWKVGPWKVQSHQFADFARKKAAMNVRVNPKTMTVGYEVFGTAKHKLLFDGEIKL